MAAELIVGPAASGWARDDHGLTWRVLHVSWVCVCVAMCWRCDVWCAGATAAEAMPDEDDEGWRDW